MTNDEPQDLSTGGPSRAPRSVLRRVIRAVLAVVVLVAVVWAVSSGMARLPEGTETSSLIVRAGVGIAIGLVLVVIVRRMLRALVEPPPPPPATVDATLTDVVYECPVCGTRVRLELAATAKAPRHCGEEMEPKLVAR